MTEQQELGSKLADFETPSGIVDSAIGPMNSTSTSNTPSLDLNLSSIHDVPVDLGESLHEVNPVDDFDVADVFDDKTLFYNDQSDNVSKLIEGLISHDEFDDLCTLFDKTMGHVPDDSRGCSETYRLPGRPNYTVYHDRGQVHADVPAYGNYSLTNESNRDPARVRGRGRGRARGGRARGGRARGRGAAGDGHDHQDTVK